MFLDASDGFVLPMMLFTVTEDLVVTRAPDAAHGVWHRYGVASECATSAPTNRRHVQEDPLSAAVVLRAPRDQKLSASHLFLANSKALSDALRRVDATRAPQGTRSAVRVLTAEAMQRVLRHIALPTRVGFTLGCEERFVPIERQVADCGIGRELRLAIVNVLHSIFGDAVLSLRLFKLLRARLAVPGRRVVIDLLQHPTHPEIERMLLETRAVDSIQHLPISLATFAEYDAYIDLSRRRMRSDRHWTDDYLERLGIDPNTVPPAQKRTWRPPRTAVAGHARERTRRGEPRLVLVHWQASCAERSLTTRATRALVARLVESHDVHVASALRLDLRHPRFHDWSPRSRSFGAFASLIARADCFVSVDTCLYHIADAFDVPGVVLFTNVRPEHRIAYYPYVEGMTLETPADGGAVDQVDADAVIAALDRVIHRRHAVDRAGDAVVPDDAASSRTAAVHP